MLGRADRSLYLTEDGQVVEESSPAQFRLLVGQGCEVSRVMLDKYGLSFDGETLKIGNDESVEVEAETQVEAEVQPEVEKPKKGGK